MPFTCAALTCTEAAKGGHFNVRKWAREVHIPWDDAACSWAAKNATSAAPNGHLDLLKRLSEQGCPWDESTCAHAALLRGPPVASQMDYGE
eukprot:scaffold602557_cov26-Prasinocladus_malaysianus.AAC.1